MSPILGAFHNYSDIQMQENVPMTLVHKRNAFVALFLEKNHATQLNKTPDNIHCTLGGVPVPNKICISQVVTICQKTSFLYAYIYIHTHTYLHCDQVN